MLTSEQIIRAWKDQNYFESLTDYERTTLPANPAGQISEAPAGPCKNSSWAKPKWVNQPVEQDKKNKMDTSEQIIRAWKDQDYYESLSEQERQMLPANPAGQISEAVKIVEIFAVTSAQCRRTFAKAKWAPSTRAG